MLRMRHPLLPPFSYTGRIGRYRYKIPEFCQDIIIMQNSDVSFEQEKRGIYSLFFNIYLEKYSP